jgi:tetratricopeptide (TPR) repeat protein
MNRKSRRQNKTQNINPAILPLLQKGQQLYNAGNAGEAVQYFTQALRTDPTSLLALEYLGRIFRDAGKLDMALDFFRQIEQIDKNHTNAISFIGRILAAQEKFEESIPYLERSFKLAPHDSTLRLIGQTYLFQGNIEAAKKAFEKAYKIDPENLMNISVYVEHVHSITSEDDPTYQKLLKGEDHSKTLPLDEQIMYQSALYKARNDLKDYAAAIDTSITIGTLQKRRFEALKNIPYDACITAMHERLDMAKAYFTADNLAKLKENEPGHDSQLPIFIIGMPRSGTTLLEQILHAHPDIEGIGEDTTFNTLMARESYLPDHKNAPYPYRAFKDSPIQKTPADIGKTYCETIQSMHPRAKRIVSKPISNMQYAPYMHLALPGAKMIHIQRDAVDTCLSCFTNIFEGITQPQTYDMDVLGDYYQRYVALMEHWNTIMPGEILNITYEEIIEDTESSARKIIDFLGLEWSDKCLEFYKNESTVKTASVTQVRQPIYKTSIAKWKKYGHSLDPLIKALGPCASEEAQGFLTE